MTTLPFEPTKVVIHPDLEDQYDAWEAAAGEGEQPAQAIWNAFQTALWRIKNDGQWGEVIPKSDIPRTSGIAAGLRTSTVSTSPRSTGASTPS